MFEDQARPRKLQRRKKSQQHVSKMIYVELSDHRTSAERETMLHPYFMALWRIPTVPCTAGPISSVGKRHWYERSVHKGLEDIHPEDHQLSDETGTRCVQ